jgi:hypothetical protein
VAGGLVLTWFLLAPPVRAAPILDQSFEAMSSPLNGHIISSTQTPAMTFTVGITGTLTRVDVEVARSTTVPSSDLLLELRSTLPGGGPSSEVLASVVIPAASVPTAFSFLPVDLTSANPQVTQGDLLAIVLQTSAPPSGGGINPYAWELDSGYPRGSSWIRPSGSTNFVSLDPIDYGFRTFVEPAQAAPVPEPSSFVLLGTAVGLLSYWRRRRALRAAA